MISDACAPAEAAALPANSAAMFEQLYRRVRSLARRELMRNGPYATLSPTTLVHEAYLQCAGRDALSFEDEARFLAYAARAMRGIVIDHVRSRQASKRGGGLHMTTLDTEAAESVCDADELQRVADATEALTQLDARLADIVNLKFFCGFTMSEIAAMHQVAERTVQRQWEKARIFLRSALVDADA